jgi:hypothetical protein
MSAPRPVFPGQFIFVTRRCAQRQFLLRPDHETNNAFVYCLAEAAQRFELDVIGSQMMSNHHHTALFDPHGCHPEFREHFHKMVAKTQNALRGRWENLWAAEESCVVEVVSCEDLLEKLVYIATNPVKDGLVEHVHQWPGPNFLAALLSGKPMRATRPRWFFRDEGVMPKEIDLVLKLPDHFEGKEAFLERLRERVAAAEKAYAEERRVHGRGILGRRRVLRQSWRDCPMTDEPRRNLRPRVAARSKWHRIAVLQRNKEWQANYRDARRRWLLGEDVEFPAGTYWLRRFANVRVASSTTTN